MPDPDKYERDFSFEGFQSGNPTSSQPGIRIDDELDRIAGVGGATIDALKDIRRSDGKLKNGIVGLDALTEQLKALLVNPVGEISSVIFAISFESIAEFRAGLVSPFLSTAIIHGYYGLGTPGGGIFVRDGNDLTTADDGGSCIVRGTVRWKRVFPGGTMALADWGVASSVGDNAPAIRAAVNFANGHLLFAHVGNFVMGSGIDTTKPINLFGCGHGAGPGSAEQFSTQATAFIANFANPTLFKVTSLRPSLFRDFRCDVHPAFRNPGDGAAIRLVAPTITNTETQANSKIENCAFGHFHKCIYFFKANWASVTGCYFGDWVDSAIMSETNASTEASAGFITNCYFFGDKADDQRACVYLRNGYTVISDCEILGAQYGVLVDIANYPAGFIRIHGNTIEENYFGGVLIKKTGTSTFVASSMVSVSDNEFSSIETAQTYIASVTIDDNGGVPWIDDVQINDNTTRHSLPAGRKHFFINGGRTMHVMRNICEELSGNLVIGIQVTGVVSDGALLAPILIADNLFRGTIDRYALTSSGMITLRDPIPEMVAKIYAWGTLRDGSKAYASDGRSTDVAAQNSTLIAGGAGASIVRSRGAWLTEILVA